MKSFVILLIFIQTFLMVSGQDFQEEFVRFRSQQNQDFLREVKTQDSVFVLAIKENWRSFQLNEPFEHLPVYPKPESQPKNVQDLNSINYKAKTIPRKLRSFKPTPYEHLDFYPVEDRLVAFDFFGQDCKIKYPSSFELRLPYEPTSDFVAKFWKKASERPYQKLVNDLIQLKEQLNIPGYGFYLLLDGFSTHLDFSHDNKIMYEWFFLLKAGYEARVGFNNGKAFLIVASDTKIYGRPYFVESGITYYVLDQEVTQIETYGAVRTDAKAVIGFVFEEAPDLPIRSKNKNFQFVHGEIAYSWNIYYNQNVVDMLEAFPLVELPSYFNSKGSFLLQKSLRKEIEKEISNKTQMEVVSLLLSFTQKAFEYQADQSQFGEERIFYPDQFIHYGFSDCDDRVVFFNYLLSLFTQVKTVALLFPQHIALGVKLPLPAYGETVDYAGNRFVFCDPTFYNAPIGAVIPQADREQMKVLSF